MGLSIVLVEAPAWGLLCPPLGIAMLKACLQERGHRVKTMDLNIQLYYAADDGLRKEWRPERHQFWIDPALVQDALDRRIAAYAKQCVRQILEQRPRVVGFTALYSTEHASLWMARQIKKAAPPCLVVFGGPQASRQAAGERILASGLVDYIVEGEGEETFAELLQAIETGSDPALCKGLLFRRDGKITGTGHRPLIPDLGALPAADFSDFFPLIYERPGLIPASLSRGCPNECAFCYEVVYWERFRIRKAESLLREIRWQRQRLPRLTELFFHDSLINGHMGELRRFAQGLLDSGERVQWGGQAVIRKEMTGPTLDLMRRSGCRWLSYGLESGSFSVMLKMGKVLAKGSDPDRIVRDTFEAGIRCFLNFMFGFPGETEDDFQMTLDFVRRNRRWISTVYPSPGFCDFHPGTYGYQRPDDYGIELREGSAHWVSKDGSNTYLTRLERFERFLALAHELRIDCGYRSRRLLLRNTIIGNYHYTYGDFAKALPYLEKAVKEEQPDNPTTRQRLAECLAKAAV